MYSCGGCAVVMPAALGALPFVFDSTPANKILKFFLPSIIMDNKWVELILSSLYWIVHGFFAVVPFTQLISIVVLVFYDSKFMVKPCYEPRIPEDDKPNPFNLDALKKFKLRLGRQKETDTVDKTTTISVVPRETANAQHSAVDKAIAAPKKKINLLKRAVKISNQFSKALNIYRQVYLIYKSVNNFGFVLFPSLIFCAFFMNVLCTFVVVKLNDILPLLIVAVMGLVDLCVFANSVAIYSFAWVITTEVEAFSEFWKSRLLRREYQLQLKTCQRIAVWVGGFFAVHQSITLEHMMQVVDMTTNLLLT